MDYIVQTILLSLLILARSSFPCSDTVTFNSTDFTITGPCPNDTVITPVGSTVQYTCKYEDNTPRADLPYWHIAELNSTPFQQGEGGDYGIVIGGSASSSNSITTGYTIIDIPVKEQYLNNTLNIQCGLCSGPVCYGPNDNVLSENIISTTVIELVTFGPPRDLSYNTNQDSVTIHWSQPSVSIDYNNTVYFQYQLTITDSIQQSTVFNTTNTHYTITTGDIPVGFDICSNYTWSVVAIYDGRASQTITSNETISIPSSPSIDSDSFYSNYSDCMNTIILSTVIKVHSCYSILQSLVTITTVSQQTYNLTITTINSNDSNIHVLTAMYMGETDSTNELLNGSITVCIDNDYGNDCDMFELEDYNMETVSCDNTTTVAVSSPTTTSTVISDSTSTVISDPSIIVSDDSSGLTSSTVTGGVSPSVNFGNTRRSSNSVYIYIIIPIILAIIVGIIILCVIIIMIIIIGKKKRKRHENIYAKDVLQSKKSLNSNGVQKTSFKYTNVPSPCLTPTLTPTEVINGTHMIPDSHPQINTIDCPTYAIPIEIAQSVPNRRTESKIFSRPMSYTPSQILSLHNHLPKEGYTEPCSSVPRVDEAVYSTICPPETTPIHPSLVDVPGYSTVHFDPTKKNKRNSRKDSIHSRLSFTPRHSCSSLPVTPAHVPAGIVLQTMNGIDETDGSNTDQCIYDEINKENISVRTISTPKESLPMYVDINEIKRRKRNKLNLQTIITNGTTVTSTSNGTSNGIDTNGIGTDHSVLSNSDDEASETTLPEYVPVSEILKRKRDKSLNPPSSIQNDSFMIELKELPPPTPTHDLATPSPPPATPPPVPPHLPSPSLRTSVN